MSLPASVPPRFAVRLVQVGRERLDRCASAVSAADSYVWIHLAADLHALAGEAAMMGLVAIGDLARKAEDECRAAAAQGVLDEHRVAMQARIAQLRASLDEVEGFFPDADRA